MICILHAALFYYLLGNIEPKLRSSLKCIQLIACVSTENLEKYGFDMILKPFIQEANSLSKVCILAHIEYCCMLHSSIVGCCHDNSRSKKVC